MHGLASIFNGKLLCFQHTRRQLLNCTLNLRGNLYFLVEPRAKEDKHQITGGDWILICMKLKQTLKSTHLFNYPRKMKNDPLLINFQVGQ